jgi:hypothetical protein
MFINYNEASEYADEAYITHIRKLYPNISENEINDMFNNFKQEMARQAEKSQERDASLRK